MESEDAGGVRRRRQGRRARCPRRYPAWPTRASALLSDPTRPGVVVGLRDRARHRLSSKEVAMTTRLYAGAAQGLTESTTPQAGGIFRLTIGDDRWERLRGGLPGDVEVRAIAVHPRESQVIYAGTQHGPYRSTDGGEHWTALGLPDPGMTVWSLLFHPRDANVFYAGAAPAAVYRTDNGGETWRRLTPLRAPGDGKMSFATRVIRLPADPTHPPQPYPGVGVDGAARSEDGSLYRSDDLGGSWRRVDRGVKARSTMMAMALHAKDPNQVYCTTRSGQVFGTQDGGGSWREYPLPDGVADVYAVACG